MRTSLILSALVALVVCWCVLPAPAAAQTPGTRAFQVAGTEAEHVSAFLRTLQTSVAVDNRYKVATLLTYPIEVWADGEHLVLRNQSDLIARYSRVFTPALKKAIAEARIETLTVDDQGVHIDAGRLCCKPQAGRPDAIRIVAINRPQ
ncbi:MAG: hypothetical protein AB1806_06100 [Acidobacteriota bacterium]